MKRQSLILAAAFALSANAQTRQISLDSVSQTMRNRNYAVLQNAMKVYQAKESIAVARGNLLPQLNIWRIAGAVIDPMSLTGMVQDIAPFVVPANWFRLEQTKILYKAEVEGYRALWGNEVLTAKSLYLQVLLDESLLAALRDAAARHQELEDIVRVRELMGAVPRGSTRAIEMRKLALHSDITEMLVLLKKEREELGFALGYPVGTKLEMKPVSIPDIAGEKPIRSSELDARMRAVSPELKQFGLLIQAVPSVKKEVYFSFLGGSSASRGVAGGVFDHLPVQDGLGFGSGASLRIIRKEAEILDIQLQGLRETLSRQLDFVVERHNADLDQAANLAERKRLADEQWELFRTQIAMGEDVDFSTLIEATEVPMGVNLLVQQHNYRFLINRQKLERMLLRGDFAKMPASAP
jgi:hypothetical protein